MTYEVKRDFTLDGVEYKEGTQFPEEVEVNLDEFAKLVSEGSVEPIFTEDDFEDFVVTQEWFDANAGQATQGDIKVGDTIKVLKDQEPEDEEKEKEVTSHEPVEVPVAKLHYMGKEVVTDTTREVEGITYHHVRLEDGSASDLTDSEYEKMVADSK